MAAQQGYLDAQYNLAVWYGSGDGVEIDQEKAFDWYLKSAMQGHESARIIVGGRLLSGSGTLADDIRGYAWLLSSENEMAKAMREAAREHMSQGDIKKAELLAALCAKTNYQGCGIEIESTI